MKSTIVVRSGNYIEDHHCNEFQAMVRSFKLPSRETCIVVSLDARDKCIIIDRFYVQPPEVYCGEHTKVLLHALSCACHIAKHLEGLDDWQLSAHLINNDLKHRSR